MNISFGKFIPVEVYINGKKVENDGRKIPKSVERVTLNMCDCFIAAKDYPNTNLEKQQRRFFASKVKDYFIPRENPENKTKITPSTVKTGNIDGMRYLITGKEDIETYKEYGHMLGHELKDIKTIGNDMMKKINSGLTGDELYRITKSYSEECKRSAHYQRFQNIREIMKDKTLNEKLVIYAKENPEAKRQKDKYIIQYIDFKPYCNSNVKPYVKI